MVVYVVSFYDKDMEQVEIVAVCSGLSEACSELNKLTGSSRTCASYSVVKNHWHFTLDTVDGKFDYWITAREVL